MRPSRKRSAGKPGIQSLKVGYNSVFGYYIEVTKLNSALVPPHYVRKQTLVNAERYITQELKEYEDAVLGAETKRKEREYDLFVKVRVAGCRRDQEDPENGLCHCRSRCRPVPGGNRGDE